VNTLFTESGHDRDTLRAAIATVGSCNNLSSAVTSLQSVVSDRQTLLTRLDSLDIARLPNHARLRAGLEQALTDSLHSDQSYEAWVEDLNDNCDASTETQDSNYLQAQQSDSTAESDKGALAQLWDPIAKKFGLPQQTANSF
jgi:hypothetical protein